MQFVSIHRKDSTNQVKTYRPIRLFPIFSKILERLTFFSECQNSFFTECQSGFIQREYKNLIYHSCSVKLSNLSLFSLSHFKHLNFNRYILRILLLQKVKLSE